MNITIVGLGYVGLPLAIKFGLLEEINGFDINDERIKQLKDGMDVTNESSEEELKKAKINFSSDPSIIKDSDFIIIAVPTPIDNDKKPDLNLLLSASSLVGKNLKKGAIVVYESTVYPSCTEKDCVPILEKESGLKYKVDFKVGYSPERINPGDKEHTVDKIVKVVSGCDDETLQIVADVYSKIINAGVHKASSIMVAEASKIIENTQRDINIALMNELKMIFDKMNIPWKEVLEAAGTKWNFLKFTPGLVGGHCIGVDPYYLAYEAKKQNVHPEMILAGRNVNDNMAKYEVSKLIKHMERKGITIEGSKILILGGTFKQDVPDIRNSKIEDLIKELKNNGVKVDICEPFVEGELFSCRNLQVENMFKGYDFVVKAVNHLLFKDVDFDYLLF